MRAIVARDLTYAMEPPPVPPIEIWNEGYINIQPYIYT